MSRDINTKGSKVRKVTENVTIPKTKCIQIYYKSKCKSNLLYLQFPIISLRSRPCATCYVMYMNNEIPKFLNSTLFTAIKLDYKAIRLKLPSV